MILRSRSDLCFSYVCGVCVCVCVRAVCMCVRLVAVQFLHLSLQPARPTLYAKKAFHRPFRALVTFPMGERHTVELFACFWCLCLCAFIFC